MRKAIYTLIAFSSLVSLGQSQNQDSLMVDSAFWENSNLKSCFLYYNGIYDYEFAYWHPNGSIQKRGRFNDYCEYISDAWDITGTAMVIEGNGYYVDFYENGQRRSEGRITEEVKDSVWTEYYTNGKIKSQGCYGLQWGYSRKLGTWIYRFDNGEIERIEQFKPGESLDTCKYFYKNGNYRAITCGSEFMNNRRYISAWDIKGDSTLKNGNGFFYEYYENGVLKSKIKIKDFVKDTAWQFFPNGRSQAISVYFTDETRPSLWQDIKLIDCWDSAGVQIARDGTGWDYNYEDGRIRGKNYYLKGLRDSIRIAYYSNGVVMEIDKFDEGDWTSRTIFFNNGNKYCEYTFNNLPSKNTMFSTIWWYNGNLKRRQLADSIIEYHPNGQIKAFGYYCQDTASPDSIKFNLDYYLTSEVENWGMGIYARSDNTQRKKTWYSDGRLRSEVLFSSIDRSLVYSEYYPNGILKSQGPIGYGYWEFESDDSNLSSDVKSFVGYLKIGIWKFYEPDGDLREEKNYEDETYENRKIRN